MKLKKTIAGFLKEVDVLLPIVDGDGNNQFDKTGKQLMSPHKKTIEIPQLDIDMHPMEEAEILALWAVGESERSEPKKPTMEEEHEMMLGMGIDAVNQKRQQWKASHDAWMTRHQPLLNAHHIAFESYKAWAAGDGGKAHRIATIDKHIEKHINENLVEFFKQKGIM